MEASAPGKVLILGSYLIVESCTPANVGISIGVNARFTTRIVKAEPTTTGASGKTTIHMRSPQFRQSFCFVANTSAPGTVAVKQTEGPGSPFIFNAVLYSVAAAQSLGSSTDGEIWVELLADNDFYSQRNYLESQGKDVNVANLRSLPPHLPLVGAISKTGLGSSAAMTTSIVACLCHHFNADGCSHEYVHRIAQIAHSVTQGKIGSGFDVYTAVYGTCAYRRFPVSRVSMMMMASAQPPSSVEVETLRRCVDMNEVWVPPESFRLPPGVKLVLGDVHQGGSCTPGMVAKIMAWRKSVADTPDNLWEQLRRNNEAYIAALRRMIDEAAAKPDVYAASMAALQQVPSLPLFRADGESMQCIVEASRFAARSRALLRDMGVAAEVKVEPVELTDLLDDTATLPGVFAVGCPGAGGYDAVFALVLGDECAAAVEAFWEHYTKMNVCPLLVREDPSGLLIQPPP
ncbi:putative phosphomevalonate kinase protein [Leishmania major strain Friedlin]|uniref:phosphomevalonate kinase n=1 Tax=Leishmania major TaxID=5664 RepID=Q4QF34_LEIMA|nr:putative phosphomevalonate kinase protein [Leishmania major strain Friedlin]CAG9571605.1 phosphomevalonate_kinase_protein_-_putative [Leishmania major strain Friedlin]CAJ03376.1 putative phosphomevalonate kinase protein [Leishmania major strain Friedlin]|eukprot:XP_001682064.1 putative phosphomevalonate kinase protein [Leishmania major strain Friedlin]